MLQEELRLTHFSVRKLQCIGSRGRASPYQITTYRGMELGLLGLVPEHGQPAANATEFARFRLQASVHWLGNVLQRMGA